MFHIKVFACASGCLQTLDLIQYIYSDLTNTHCNKSLTIIEKKRSHGKPIKTTDWFDSTATKSSSCVFVITNTTSSVTGSNVFFYIFLKS